MSQSIERLDNVIRKVVFWEATGLCDLSRSQSGNFDQQTDGWKGLLVYSSS
jgi:hypothetical protein